MGYTDPEKAAAYAREWRAKHADKVRTDDRERRAKARIEDPSAATQKMREWRAANPEKAQAQAKISNERYKLRMKQDADFRKKELERKAIYKAKPEVQERNRKLWREWAADNYKNFPERQRKNRLKQAYGITVEQYDVMVLAQRGTCAVCGTDKPGGRSIKYWCVDHCHVRNQVRKLLCHACNTGLGAFKDKPDLLRAAAAYLEKHQS